MKYDARVVARRVREELVTLARATVAALGGERAVREVMREVVGTSFDEVWAVGKAAAAMARGSGLGGLVIGKHDERVADGVRAFNAGHPLPDERGERATRMLLQRARALPSTARVLLCLSGGASALLAAPVDGVTLETLREATRALQNGGAPIGEINLVRRHLGAALGGKLAAATRASIDVLAISDVVGNDPAAIGSGPASPDPSTLDDARRVARAYGLSREVIEAIDRAPETPKPGDPIFERVSYRILASPSDLVETAARLAQGFSVEKADTLVQGPVEEVARTLADRARALPPYSLFVAAGEPTVVVSGSGRGGRAQHLALLMARALAGSAAAFVALGSDGSDGPTDAAGGAVDGTTWAEARALGHSPDDALASCDSHTLLSALGATLVTGATGTNLTDLLLVGRGA
jgi:hydroxypyruvate reductase